jgi:hypothetical protein
MADKDDKHEDPVMDMITEMKSITGYKAYLIVNNVGIVLKYEGFEVRPHALASTLWIMFVSRGALRLALAALSH